MPAEELQRFPLFILCGCTQDLTWLPRQPQEKPLEPHFLQHYEHRLFHTGREHHHC